MPSTTQQLTVQAALQSCLLGVSALSNTQRKADTDHHVTLYSIPHSPHVNRSSNLLAVIFD